MDNYAFAKEDVPTKKSDERLEVLLKLTAAFQQHESGIIIFDRVLDVLKDAIGYSSCSIHLIDNEHRYAYLVASHGVPADFPEAIMSEIRVESLSQDYMLPLLENEPYRPVGRGAGQGCLSTVNAEDVFSGDMVKVPLLSDNHLVGVLTIINSELNGNWFDENQEWLSTIGKHVGMLVDQAQLYGKAQARAVAEEQRRIERGLREQLAGQIEEIHNTAKQVSYDYGHNKTHDFEKKLSELVKLSELALLEVTEEMKGLSLIPAPEEDLITQISTYLVDCQEQWGIKTTLSVIDPYGAMRHQTNIGGSLFRTVQESLVNVRKHAKANKVDVTLEVDADALRVIIVDDGIGFVLSDVPENSLGISSMRAHVRDMGGTLRIMTSPGEGTVVSVEVPLSSLAGMRGGGSND